MSSPDEDRGPRTRQRLWLLAAVVVVAAVVVAVLAIANGASDEGPQGLGGGEQLAGATETNALFDGIPQQGIELGDPDAPVTLVEFIDLQCPFCGQFARGTLPELVERYVRPGQLRIELQVLGALGDDSLEAAQVAAAASLQDRMWQFSEVFFRNQGKENSGYVTRRFLLEVAGSVDGLDGERALAEAGDQAVEDVVEGAARAAGTLGVSGTPTFYAGPTDGGLEELRVKALTIEALLDELQPLLDDAR